MKIRRCLSVAVFLISAWAGATSVSFADPMFCSLPGIHIAITCGFSPTNGQPAEATTAFIGGVWDNPMFDPNPIVAAMHELFHGIGFSYSYVGFRNHIIDTPGAGADGIPELSGSYSTDGSDEGILIVVLPSLEAHADPNATGKAPWPATTYDQSKDLMLPNAFAGPTVFSQDVKVLNDAFEWSIGGIGITINNLTPQLFSFEESAMIRLAALNTEAFFNVNVPPGAEPKYSFVWNIYETPEPNTLILLVVGLAGIGTWRWKTGKLQ